MKAENSLSVLVQFIFFMAIVNITCHAQSEINIRDNINIKRIIENYDTIIPLLMKEQNIPALSIALIDRKGIVWSNCYGFINADKTTPNNSETIFSIQSISNTITATAILLAVEEGLLNLDTPIREYIPEFNINSYFDDEPSDVITLRHLLSHTAGLAHEASLGNNFTYDSPTFEEHVHSIQKTSLRYPVGQRYSYSNLGIDLAAYILQVVSNKPFHQYLQEKVFSPLEMNSSSANPEVILANKNRADGHSRGKEERRIIVPMQGAGGVYTCVNDFAKFVQFHLNSGIIEGNVLLNPSLLEEMYTVQFPIKEQTSGYALGIDTYRKHNSLFLYHSGGGYGYLADMAWYKELGIGMVVHTNSADHNLQGKLYNEILDKIINSQIKETLNVSNEVDIQEYKLETEKKQYFTGNYIGRFGYMNNSDRLSKVEPGVFITCKGEIMQFGEKILFASIFDLVKI